VVPPDAAVVPPDAAVVPPDADLVPPDADLVPPDADVVPPDADVVPPDADVVPPDAAVVPPDAAPPAPDAAPADGAPPLPDGAAPLCAAEDPPVCVDGHLDGCAPDGQSFGRVQDCPNGCEDAACLPGCGDGVLQDGESCDDGGQRAGDGCTELCAVECGAFDFGDPDQFVQVGDAENLTLHPDPGFTLELWYAPTRNRNNAVLAEKRNPDGGGAFWSLRLVGEGAGGDSRVEFEIGSGANFCQWIAPTPGGDSSWVHVAVVRRPPTVDDPVELRIYVNGRGANSQWVVFNCEWPQVVDTDGDIRIGGPDLRARLEVIHLAASALYTADFEPAPFLPVRDSSVLLLRPAAHVDGTVPDASGQGNAGEITGVPVVPDGPAALCQPIE
jgi:cysteine-rich repeat protein